jgi:hypothetical protein
MLLRRRALNDEVKQSHQPADLPKGPTQVTLKGRKWSTVGIDRLCADQGSTFGFRQEAKRHLPNLGWNQSHRRERHQSLLIDAQP